MSELSTCCGDSESHKCGSDCKCRENLGKPKPEPVVVSVSKEVKRYACRLCGTYESTEPCCSACELANFW